VHGEQILAAARDFTPVYYERYIIDMRNRPPDVQQGAIDRIHWFFSLSPADRRACSEDLATNIYAEPMAQRGQLGEGLLQQQGCRGRETDHRTDHPPGDPSVWNG
jgi:hypothetical protein